jgi:DHA2 family multidrug resistance protein-like MFS transporter
MRNTEPHQKYCSKTPPTSGPTAPPIEKLVTQTPIATGAATVPSALAFIVGSLVVPPVARRASPAYIVGVGAIVSAVGFGVLTQVNGPSALAVIIIGSVVYSLGLSPVVILATDLIVGSAPVERAGVASAISETSSELGGALGIAVLGSIGVVAYRGAMTHAIPTGVPEGATQIAKGTLGGAVAVAAQLGPPVGSELLAAAREAFDHAFVVAAAASAAVALAVAALAVLLTRPESGGEASDSRVLRRGR